jgi:membrane-bound serine protease (ClpP class)
MGLISDPFIMITLIVVLLVGGVLLLVLENFVPGFVLGTLGLISIFAGSIITYAQFGFTFGTLVLGMVVIFASIIFFVSLRNFQRTATSRLFTNTSNIGSDSGYAASQDLLGKSGIALTQLRPSGSAMINGRKIDVVTQGDLIPINEQIEVIQVEGMRVVVRRMDTDDRKYRPGGISENN